MEEEKAGGNGKSQSKPSAPKAEIETVEGKQPAAEPSPRVAAGRPPREEPNPQQ